MLEGKTVLNSQVKSCPFLPWRCAFKNEKRGNCNFAYFLKSTHLDNHGV